MRTEAAVQSTVRAEAPRQGFTLWRNNSGACYDETGRLIRYGLGNDSAQINRRFKSADLIGLLPVTIGPQHVGRTLAVFVGIECKAPGWNYSANRERDAAQAAWLSLVQERGGIGGFVTHADQLRILRESVL